MKLRMIVTTLTAAVILLPATASARQAEDCRPPMRTKWEELGLTDQQKEQIRELHKENRSWRSESMKEIAEVRGNIRDEMLKEHPDRNRLNSHAEKLGDLYKAATDARIEYFFELKTVLTDEQFSKVVGNNGARQQHMHRKGQGFQKK